jgi:hypothetical protein
MIIAAQVFFYSSSHPLKGRRKKEKKKKRSLTSRPRLGKIERARDLEEEDIEREAGRAPSLYIFDLI